MDITRGLVTSGGVEITNLNANWQTKTYELGDNVHLGVHIFWDNIALTGIMTLEYSCDPLRDGQNESANWVPKDVTNIDGSFTEIMFLDANLPVACFRLRFEHVSGAASLSSFISKKRG